MCFAHGTRPETSCTPGRMTARCRCCVLSRHGPRSRFQPSSTTGTDGFYSPRFPVFPWKMARGPSSRTPLSELSSQLYKRCQQRTSPTVTSVFRTSWGDPQTGQLTGIVDWTHAKKFAREVDLGAVTWSWELDHPTLHSDGEIEILRRIGWPKCDSEEVDRLTAFWLANGYWNG